MKAYDPLNAQNSDDWRLMDEDERLTLVMEYHRRAGVELPNEQAHAAIHVIVENQIVLGDEIPIQATLERLLREGLDRHDAIHAIGSVLANFMNELIADDEAVPKINEMYYEELGKLTVANWHRDYQ